MERESSSCEYFLTVFFLWGGVVSTSPNPQAGGPPLVGCPRLLIHYIRIYPPYWRPFLHPQPDGMYLPLLIKLFSLALKCCFIPKTVRCLWCIVYNLSSLHHHEIKHFSLCWSLRLRIRLPKERGNMEVIILFT